MRAYSTDNADSIDIGPNATPTPRQVLLVTFAAPRGLPGCRFCFHK
jgi:hypothetical protein